MHAWGGSRIPQLSGEKAQREASPRMGAPRCAAPAGAVHAPLALSTLSHHASAPTGLGTPRGTCILQAALQGSHQDVGEPQLNLSQAGQEDLLPAHRSKRGAGKLPSALLSSPGVRAGSTTPARTFCPAIRGELTAPQKLPRALVWLQGSGEETSAPSSSCLPFPVQDHEHSQRSLL